MASNMLFKLLLLSMVLTAHIVVSSAPWHGGRYNRRGGASLSGTTDPVTDALLAGHVAPTRQPRRSMAFLQNPKTFGTPHLLPEKHKIVPIFLDMETGDPDDLLNLMWLAGHPAVRLVGVTVTPGSPAQLLLVQRTLQMVYKERERLGLREALPFPPLGFGKGFANTNLDHEDSLQDPFAACSNPIYRKFVKGWEEEVLSAFGGGPHGGEHGNRGHERLKALVLDAEPAWQLMHRVLTGSSDVGTTLVTGGPLTNLRDAIWSAEQAGHQHPSEGRSSCVSSTAGNRGTNSFRVHRWVGQGGFAGDNVVPKAAAAKHTDDFFGVSHCPTFNFNEDITAANRALSSDKIGERVLLSKNVCHRVIFDQHTAEKLKYQVEDMERVAKKLSTHNWRKDSVPESDRLFSPAFNPVVSAGLPLFHRFMISYKNSRDKKLHDLVAGLAGVQLELAGCEFAEVRQEIFRRSGRDRYARWGCLSSSECESTMGKRSVNCRISVDFDPDALVGGLLGTVPVPKGLVELLSDEGACAWDEVEKSAPAPSDEEEDKIKLEKDNQQCGGEVAPSNDETSGPVVKTRRWKKRP